MAAVKTCREVRELMLGQTSFRFDSRWSREAVVILVRIVGNLAAFVRANGSFAPGGDQHCTRGGARTERHEKILAAQGAMDRGTELSDVEVGAEQRARNPLGFQQVLREVRGNGVDGGQKEIEL